MSETETVTITRVHAEALCNLIQGVFEMYACDVARQSGSNESVLAVFSDVVAHKGVSIGNPSYRFQRELAEDSVDELFFETRGSAMEPFIKAIEGK